MRVDTAALFYRPTEPPRVTVRDLAGFVRELMPLGLFADEDLIRLELKFGRAIDQDERPSDWDEPIAGAPGISVAAALEWDVGEYVDSLAGLADRLDAAPDRPIYRANVFLGRAAGPIGSGAERPPNPDEDDDGLSLDSWMLQIGPILSYALDSGAATMVGWIALRLSGQGQIWPETPREVIERLASCPGVDQVEALCRRTWPIRPGKPPRAVVKAREQMGDLWPYDKVDRPWDWYWGLAESG